MNKFKIGFIISLCVSIFINVILMSIVVNSIFGRVNWLKYDKEMKVEKKIIKRYKELKWFLKKDKRTDFDKFILKEYRPIMPKKIFSNKNFPVVIKKVPYIELNNEEMIKVLALYKYIEQEHNQLYYRTNYIRE